MAIQAPHPLAGAPAVDFAAITKSDSANFTKSPCRAIYVGGAGDVVAVSYNDVAVTFAGATAGSVLSIQAKRVNSTGTTATLMVALY